MSLPEQTTDPSVARFVKHLHVISSLDPQGGGPAEGVRQLSDAAIALGHPVEIATLDPPDAPWAAAYACPVHQLGPTHLGAYRYSGKLQRWLKENVSRFDAIVVNGLWQFHGLATWRAVRNTAIPYFVFTHGMLDPWFRRTYPLKHLKKSLYWPWAEYRLLRDARAVLFTCEEEKRLARQSFSLYRANETVVSFGTPGPIGDAIKQREMFLDRFPHLRNKRLLLFLGRMHPKKGCDLLIDAFAAVARSHPSLHLVMAGPGPDALLRELARRTQAAGLEANVSWTGMLTGDLKWGAYHAAEVFVLPSHQENFGIAVTEALACAVPVLISNKVNIWREISADHAGITAEDTVAGTRDLLRGWLALSAFERQKMSRNAVACFRKRFHIDAAAQSLLSVLQDTMPGQRKVA